MKLNVYETLEWNFTLKKGVSSEFHFIVYNIAVLENAVKLTVDSGLTEEVYGTLERARPQIFQQDLNG